MDKDLIYRYSHLERADEKDEPVFRVLMSTDEPVLVYDPMENEVFLERLEHSDGAIDLDFLNSGRAPVLFEHRRDTQIGVVEKDSADLSDEGLQGIIRLSESGSAADIAADVKNGIRSNVSVGYKVEAFKILGTDPEIGVRTRTVTKWKPFELSIVSWADEKKEIENMEDKMKEMEDRRAKIAEIAKEFGMERQALDFEGTVEEFQALALREMARKAQAQVFVPYAVLRAVTTTNNSLQHVENLEVADPIAERLVASEIRANVLSGLNGEYKLPVVVSDGAANAPGEGVAAADGTRTAGVITYDEWVSYKNAARGQIVVIGDKDVSTALEVTRVDTGSGAMLMSGDRIIGGYQFYRSDLMPAKIMLLADPSEIYVGFWGEGVDLIVDQYTRANTGEG